MLMTTYCVSDETLPVCDNRSICVLICMQVAQNVDRPLCVCQWRSSGPKSEDLKRFHANVKLIAKYVDISVLQYNVLYCYVIVY